MTSHILRYSTGICLSGMRKIMHNLRVVGYRVSNKTWYPKNAQQLGMNCSCNVFCLWCSILYWFLSMHWLKNNLQEIWDSKGGDWKFLPSRVSCCVVWWKLAEMSWEAAEFSDISIHFYQTTWHTAEDITLQHDYFCRICKKCKCLNRSVI